MAVVGSPAYFAARPVPKKPQDLTNYNFINVGLPTHGGLLRWDFQKGTHKLNVRIDGQAILNGFPQVINAALAGMGLTFTLEEVVQEHTANSRFVRVLRDWCRVFPGYYLYYPSRRQSFPAFSMMIVNALMSRE